MYTFGPMIAKNARSGRLLGGAPITVTTLDGVTLDTYTVDGQPLTLVSNHEGYAGTFRADTDQRVILARPRGGDPLPLYAHEAIGDAAEAADTINTGRLSEDALTSTYATLTDDELTIGGTPLPPSSVGALPANAITVDTSVGTAVRAYGHLVAYESGWRDISSYLSEGWTGAVYVMRNGSTVHLAMENLRRAPGGGQDVLSAAGLPYGYRPRVPLGQLRLSVVTLDGATRRGYVTTSGVLALVSVTTTDAIYDTVSFPTFTATPTALPGSPA